MNGKDSLICGFLTLGICVAAAFAVDTGEMAVSRQADASYLSGARLTLLAGRTESQILSAVLETREGSLIVIDGGLPEDGPYLEQVIEAKGGKVAAWLITHPHSDHIGALTWLLEEEGRSVEIQNVYGSFLDPPLYRGFEPYRSDMVEESRKAILTLPEEAVKDHVTRGQTIKVDDVTIHVMNDPFFYPLNTINNSSVAYRIDVGGRRLLFLGDLGPEGGKNLLSVCSREELQSDVVQMSHHGQSGVAKEVYQTIRPEICLWPTPEWLWNNDKGGLGIGTGPWSTMETRLWMEELNVKQNICVKDGDQVLK